MNHSIAELISENWWRCEKEILSMRHEESMKSV
jgi:hypothetical protein